MISVCYVKFFKYVGKRVWSIMDRKTVFIYIGLMASVVGGALFVQSGEQAEKQEALVRTETGAKDSSSDTKNTASAETNETRQTPAPPANIGTSSPSASPSPAQSAASVTSSSGGTDIGQITEGMKGENVTVIEGKGHVFFTLKSLQTGATIKCVLFSSDASANPARVSLVHSAYDAGATVHVTGKVDIYKGELEIKARKIFTE